MRLQLALIYFSHQDRRQPHRNYIGTVTAIDYDPTRPEWPGWTMALKEVRVEGARWREDHVWVRLHTNPALLEIGIDDTIRIRAKVIRYPKPEGGADFTLGHITRMEKTAMRKEAR